MDDSLLSEEVLWKWMNENLDSWSTKTVTSAVVKFSITIKTHASIWGGGTICSNPLLEEIKRRRHVMLDGHTPCATHAICDGDAASLAIDTSKKSTAFGGIVSFCGSSSLIHGFNDGTVSQDHKWCHQSFLLMSATVVDWAVARPIVSHKFPVWVVKEMCCHA